MKNIVTKLLFFALVITTTQYTISADENNLFDNPHSDDFYTIWLPGLHGGRAEENSLLTTKNYTIYDVIHPAAQADLGQDECIRDFERQLNIDQEFARSKKVILIGSSQGAATLLNKLAQMPYAQQEAKIAALILEAPLADGNEAIMQSALKVPGLAYAPLVRFWSPWIGKAHHRHYNPYGMQAVISAAYISANIPVIILHNKRDARISVNSARKLVCAFLNARQGLPNNVYYIETDLKALYGDSHTDFLREDASNSAAFHAICKQIGLPYDDQQSDQFNNKKLPLFQPCAAQLENEITKDTWRSVYARNVIDGLTVITMAAALSFLIKKLYSNSQSIS